MVRGIFNFRKGQCLFIRANRQTNRYRLLSFRNLFSSVFVHKGSICQKCACFLFAHDRIVDICPHGIRLEKHEDIIVHFRIFCKMSKFICSVFQRFQFCSVQLKEQNREVFDSAFHGYFFAKRPISPIFLLSRQILNHITLSAQTGLSSCLNEKDSILAQNTGCHNLNFMVCYESKHIFTCLRK